MSRSRIEVRPLPRDWAPPGEAKHIWTIEHDGLPCGRYFNRLEAVRAARLIARQLSNRDQDAELIILSADGRIDHLESFRASVVAVSRRNPASPHARH